VFAPAGFALSAGIEPGRRIRMGEALMMLPPNEIGRSSIQNAAARRP
jgi:hypothetical protein